ncbi:MAG: S1C family serine protease [Treponema sp.]|nr:S1C family serine protease [Treponema sp.]
MKIKGIFIECIVLLFLVSCTTLKQPKNVTVPLDYTDDDIVQNEISIIKELLQKDPVKALWRSNFISINYREEMIKTCSDYILEKMQEAYDNKDYFEALKYKRALIAAGQDELVNSYEDLSDSMITVNVPGLLPTSFEKNLEEGDYLPKNIANCVDGTCTIWVDKGLRVENGSGYADIVIGSGFFIDKRGYLITNHHVISDMVDSKYEGYSRLYIKLPSDMDTKIPAKVIGYDPIIDLALLKVEITPDFVFSLGSSLDLTIGDKVSAIGTPIGLEGTLTSGIVSNINRKLTTMGSVFQLDAAVNSGNSGGPLIDENFKVQAVVFAGMLQFQGLNFAIPVEYLKQELPLLYKGGEYMHSWICAYGHTKRIQNKKVGLEIQYVMPGGSAAFSGLQVGDVITEVNGCPILTIDDFQFEMLKYEAGSVVSCKYLTPFNEEKTVPLYLEKRPTSPLVEIYKSDLVTDSFVPIFGMKLVRSSTINRKSYKIVSVIKGSSADEMGFSENDPVTIQDVKFDNEHNYFFAQLYVQRRKRGFLDIVMTLASAYDSPFYF